jgi:hypothetical protein
MGLLHGCLRLSGNARLGTPNDQREDQSEGKMDGCISASPWDSKAQNQSGFNERVVFQRLPNVTHQGDRFVFRQ